MKISVNDVLNATGGTLLQGNPDTLIDGFSTNSKEISELDEKNVLFVPVMGEKVDGHLFIPAAVNSGAKAFFIRKGHFIPDGVEDTAAIEVEDTVAALQQTALWYRSRFDIPLIGVTGSVGKTTTKEMIAAALSSINIHKTKGNANSQVGLPITLFGLSSENKAAIIEMGMSECGEMEKLAKTARPNFGIFTNVGTAHIGNIGSKENILAEKLRMTDCFTDNDILFINADDELLVTLTEDDSKFRPENVKRIVTFGTSPDADFYASSISVSGEGTDFVANYKNKEGRLLAEHIHINTLGIHNVRNALAAIAIAMELGVSSSDVKAGLASYEPLKMRGNIIKSSGITIIDDTYNASPDSMKAAIQMTGEMRGGIEPIRRRIAVLADVLELGESSASEHFGVGEYIKDYNKNDSAHRIHYLLTVGNDSAQIGYGATSEVLETNPVTKHFDSNADAIVYLKSILKSGDAVVIKGSRGMHTEEIVNSLTVVY